VPSIRTANNALERFETRYAIAWNASVSPRTTAVEAVVGGRRFDADEPEPLEQPTSTPAQAIIATGIIRNRIRTEV